MLTRTTEDDQSTSNVDPVSPVPDFEPPPIAVTVDAVVLTERDSTVLVALVERKYHPFQGSWALPGGFVEVDEDLPVAASRELEEETGLRVPPDSLAQLGAYGRPGRDPRMRTVSIVYWAHITDPGDPVGDSDASASRWFPVVDALGEDLSLAFDHNEILRAAVEASKL